MTSPATIIPKMIRQNIKAMVFLDLNIDEDFDSSSFLDLISSLKHNHTIRYLTLVRNESQQRSIKEIRKLAMVAVKLPNLETLDFENFAQEEQKQFEDLYKKESKRGIHNLLVKEPKLPRLEALDESASSGTTDDDEEETTTKNHSQWFLL